MRGIRLLSFAAVFAIAALGLACQNTANVNTNSTMASNTNMAGMDHNSMTNMNHDMGNMAHDMSNMGGMTSAPGAASQPYDLQFIDSMTHHHQGAIMMSEMALQKTTREELKPFLRKIIEDQKKEIERMKEWRDKWYSGKPSALNMEMPGMMMGSDKMKDGSHMKDMQAMSGKDFDTHFIDMMVPHHEGAVAMAKDALQKAEHPEIKTLANEVIKEQESEIKQMQGWKTEWSK